MTRATNVEIAWTAVAILGFLVQIWATWDAYRDWQTVRRLRGNGAKGVKASIAGGHIRNGLVFSGIHLLFAIAGALALTTVDVSSSGESRTLRITIFMAVAVGLVINGLLDRRIRLRLRRSTASRKENP